MLNSIIGFIMANIKYVILILAGIFVFKKVTHTILKIVIIILLILMSVHFTGFTPAGGYWSPQKSLIQCQYSVQAKMQNQNI